MDNRLFFTSTQRNRYCIGDVLSNFIPERGSLLEIGSGSGEHGVIFQKRFPKIYWQTSDPVFSHRKSISAWIKYEGLRKKMPQPLDIDVEIRPWPITLNLLSNLKGIICINMIHIAPWSSTKALFDESSNLLKQDQFLMLYGPFKKDGNHTSKSNSLFDQSLKTKDITWGIRDLEKLIELAIRSGFKEDAVIQMPANNLSVIFRRR